MGIFLTELIGSCQVTLGRTVGDLIELYCQAFPLFLFPEICFLFLVLFHNNLGYNSPIHGFHAHIFTVTDFFHWRNDGYLQIFVQWTHLYLLIDLEWVGSCDHFKFPIYQQSNHGIYTTSDDHNYQHERSNDHSYHLQNLFPGQFTEPFPNCLSQCSCVNAAHVHLRLLLMFSAFL